MESPDEIAWDHLVSTLFELINAKFECVEAESGFKSGKGSFDVYKMKRSKVSAIETSLKVKFDSYVLGLLERDKKSVDL